jgi:hypothetical protein
LNEDNEPILFVSNLAKKFFLNLMIVEKRGKKRWRKTIVQ